MLLFSGVPGRHHLVTGGRNRREAMFSSALLDHVGVTFSSTVPGLTSNDGATAKVATQVNLELQGLVLRPPDRNNCVPAVER